MMVPGGSNGEDAPGSMRNPVPLDEDCQVTVVPALTQKRSFPFAPGMLGVAEDEYEVRLTLTVQGVDADPQVLPALHILAGLGFAQASLLLSFLSSAAAKLAISRTGNSSREQ